MGVFINNMPISCSCGYTPVYGNEEEIKNPYNGKTIIMCSWICPRCGQLVRRDEVEKDEETK